ncbi:MAG: N-acetylornithine carbamoyltransferase [Bacteroidota bacterium]|jgi:N-succinyl-L-ornithine transcarbamylase|nr:N-acetylornithine carbamoyltransferase [Bacteroidota bacterium]
MKQFLSVHDADDVTALVADARRHKSAPFHQEERGRRRTLGLVFFNPSLRTRLSTQRAAQNLGMQVIVLDAGRDAWQLEFADGTVMDGGTAEHIREAAAVLGEYCDIIGVRAFPTLTDRDVDSREEVLDSIRRYSGRPLLSLESATRHPLQSLADCVTIDELRPVSRPKVVLTWAPHPRALPHAVPNSFVEWMRAFDVDLVVTHPAGYELAPEFMQDTIVEYDQAAAFDGAHFIYAKNWSSYAQYGTILRRDTEWMVTAGKMARTDNARFMHCLPVRRNVVVEDAVLDSPASVVIQQAGNRIWSAQAVLARMLEAL